MNLFGKEVTLELELLAVLPRPPPLTPPKAGVGGARLSCAPRTTLYPESGGPTPELRAANDPLP